MLDPAVLSTVGYVFIIVALFITGIAQHVGKDGGCCTIKGLMLALLGFIFLLLSVWVH